MKFILAAIVMAFGLSTYANSVTSNDRLEKLGLNKLYGASYARIMSPSVCYSIEAFFKEPAAFNFQFLSKNEAIAELKRLGLEPSSFPFAIKAYYYPVDSCQSMQPLKSGPNISKFNFNMLAQGVEILNEKPDMIELKLSITCLPELVRMLDWCGEGMRANWIIRIPKKSDILDFHSGIQFPQFTIHYISPVGRPEWSTRDSIVSYENLNGDPKLVRKFIGGDGSKMEAPFRISERTVFETVPLEQLPVWLKSYYENLPKCDKLLSEAEKTRSEANILYTDLFSSAMNGGAKLKGPDGRGLRNLSKPYEDRAELHLKQLNNEPTCSNRNEDIKKFERAMEVLVEELRKIEILSQSMWG